LILADDLERALKVVRQQVQGGANLPGANGMKKKRRVHRPLA
jgi:hypothetical protein